MKVRFFPQPKAFLARLSLGSGIILFLPFINSWHWILDLGSHFQVQAVTLQLLLLITYLLLKSWKASAITAGLLLIGMWHLFPFLGRSGTEKEPSNDFLRVTTLNVLSSNLKFEQVTDYLKKQESDIIFLSEITEIWHRAITKELSSYPHTYTETRSDNFGTLLLSRHPLKKQQRLHPTYSGEPIIHAEIDYKGTLITVLGLHPIPPVGAASSRDNYEYLRTANTLACAAKTPLIIMGDFNATPWGANYRLLTQQTNLQSCANGENRLTTWEAFQNTWVPFDGLMLDHILYSPEFKKHSYLTTSGLGSDHDGLTSDLELIIQP